MAQICKDYGWTFEEYQNQPWWFLEIIKLKMSLEGEHEKKEAERSKHK